MEKSLKTNCGRKGLVRVGIRDAGRKAPAPAIAPSRIVGDRRVIRGGAAATTGSMAIVGGLTGRAPIAVRRTVPGATALDRSAALRTVAVVIEAPIAVPRIVAARRIELAIAAYGGRDGGRERRNRDERVPWDRVARGPDSAVPRRFFPPSLETVCN